MSGGRFDYVQFRFGEERGIASTCLLGLDWRTTMDTIKRGFEEGVRAARYMGTEFQANPGSSRREYLDSSAWYFGYDTYAEMPDKERQACAESFNAGVKAERELQ
jgi:hypothetical protein